MFLIERRRGLQGGGGTASTAHSGEGQFRGKVDEALAVARKVLDDERSGGGGGGGELRYLGDTAHTYGDKFAVVERATNATVVSTLHLLQGLGMSRPVMVAAQGWARRRRAVTLRFSSEHRCAFVRLVTRSVEDPVKRVKKNIFGGVTTTKTFHDETDYHWRYTQHWTLALISMRHRGGGDGGDREDGEDGRDGGGDGGGDGGDGGDGEEDGGFVEDRVILGERSGNRLFENQTEAMPYPGVTTMDEGEELYYELYY